MIEVLDKGYVKLINVAGTELMISNAARASYMKASVEFGPADKKLINFLVREDHTSPFRHVFLTFEVKAPIMVARQWWKYVVGSDHTMDAWNEASRRYVTMEPEFYVPTEWREKPENSKQGSGENVSFEQAQFWIEDLVFHIERSIELYDSAILSGIAPEMARLFLPAYAMYTNWWWSASLQSVMHMLDQRLEHDAQLEFQEYAWAIKQLTEPNFPNVFEAYNAK